MQLSYPLHRAQQSQSSLSSFAKTATEIWNSANVSFVMSEEEIGLKLGMMALAVDVLADKSNVSDQYKNMAAEHTQKVAQSQIDKVNKELNVYEKPHIFPELNTSVINNIIDTMRGEYANTKNISSAIQKGSAQRYVSYNNRLSTFQSDASTTPPTVTAIKAHFGIPCMQVGIPIKHIRIPLSWRNFILHYRRYLMKQSPLPQAI